MHSATLLTSRNVSISQSRVIRMPTDKERP